MYYLSHPYLLTYEHDEKNVWVGTEANKIYCSALLKQHRIK